MRTAGIVVTVAALVLCLGTEARGQRACDSARVAAGTFHKAGDTTAWHAALREQIRVCDNPATAGKEVFGDYGRGSSRLASHQAFLKVASRYNCDSTRVQSVLAEADTTPYMMWARRFQFGVSDVCDVLLAQGVPAEQNTAESANGSVMVFTYSSFARTEYWFRSDGKRWI